MSKAVHERPITNQGDTIFPISVKSNGRFDSIYKCVLLKAYVKLHYYNYM
jgi:hypothetical protein